MSACIRHQCDNHDFHVNVHNHTGGVRKRFIFVSGKSLVNPIILTSLPLVPLIFRDDSFSRLDDWSRACRCRRVHRGAVVTREGESRVLGKSRARAVDKARDVNERMSE